MSCRQKIKIEKRREVFNKGCGRCAICGEEICFDHFTIDHIIPLTRGGMNTIDNLQPTCYTCNMIKIDLTPDEFYLKISQILFHNIKEVVETWFKCLISKIWRKTDERNYQNSITDTH